MKYTEPTAARRSASRGLGAKLSATSRETVERREKSTISSSAAAESGVKVSTDAASALSSDASEKPSTELHTSDSVEQLEQQLYTTPLCVFLPIYLFSALVIQLVRFHLFNQFCISTSESSVAITVITG